MARKRPTNPAKVTLRNIGRFLKGYLRKFGEDFGLLEPHQQEQVKWRAAKAHQCMENRACLYCGCHTPAKFYDDSACEDPVRQCYPEMMDAPTWEVYKKENGIKIEIS